MEFEIKLDYTVEDFKAYWQSFINKKPDSPASKPASPREMRIWGLVFLAACIPTVIVLHPLMGVLELILGVLLLALSFYAGKPQPSPRWVKRMWKKYQEGGQLYNCCFAEDGCWIHDSKGDHRYDYAALTILWEDPEHFYLVTPGNSVYILRKDSFSHGRPENLPAFWEAQTGKPVQQVQ